MIKYLSIILLILGFSIQLSAQMITAPNPLTIEANQSNVDAGDFVINWANTTDNILVSLNLDYHIGASISFPTTTGLTLNTGYTSWTNVTSIVFYGTKTNVNAALAAMTLSTGSMKTAVKIALEATLYDVNYKYNPVNKHFYQYISGNVAYATAKTNAGTYSFKGKTGYLATITSDSENNFINNNISGNNIWLALTDAASEGNWVIDAGPENGTLIKTSNGQLTGNLDGQYNNWCSAEPNDAGSNEDYAASKWNGGTCWNDLPSSYASVQGYIVEISADFPAGSGYTGVYSAYTVHNNDIAFSLASANTSNLSASTVSNFPNYFGGIQMNDGHTLTIGSGKTINTNKVLFQGSGKMILTDNTSIWTPGTPNATNTYLHSPSTNTSTTYWKV
ncbi:MAG: lectin-like protein, partial [Aquirufa sp.]